MTVASVLLPVFVLVLLPFLLLGGTFRARRAALIKGEVRIPDMALDQPVWPVRATQFGNAYKNYFEITLLFYVLVALALPLRQMDLIQVILSWVFVILRYIHAGVFVTSNHVTRRALTFFAGTLVLLIMWVYFALKILLGI